MKVRVEIEFDLKQEAEDGTEIDLTLTEHELQDLQYAIEESIGTEDEGLVFDVLENSEGLKDDNYPLWDAVVTIK